MTATATLTVPDTLGEARPYIGGKWLAATSAGTMDKIDPRNGQVHGTVHLAGAVEVDAAVAAAKAALPEWRELPGAERRKILLRLEQIIEEHAPELGGIAAREGGTSEGLAIGGHFMAASWFGYPVASTTPSPSPTASSASSSPGTGR
jgi:aldehyde dehydrogenase (NAD+)